LASFIKHGSEKDKIPEINKLIQKKEGIKMAAETLITISKDENERARLLLAEKNHLDWLDGIRGGVRRGKAEEKAEVLDLIDSGISMSELRQRLSR
jgi:hypothetical protein